MSKIIYNGVTVRGMKAKEVFDFLKQRYGDQLTPNDIARDAKDPDNPLHHYFEWNDGIAADLYRIQQARLLLCSLVKEEDNKKYRLLHNIMGDDDGNNAIGFNSTESKYMFTEDILLDEELKLRLLNRAKKELESFMNKYKTLNELVGVFNAIEEILHEYEEN